MDSEDGRLRVQVPIRCVGVSIEQGVDAKRQVTYVEFGLVGMCWEGMSLCTAFNIKESVSGVGRGSIPVLGPLR